MKKLGKILLLMVSVSPISAWILLMTLLGSGVTITTNEPLFIIILVAFISIPIQWIFFIANVFRNTTIAKDQRAFWVVLLLFFHFVIFPFYWYFHIWRDDGKPREEQTSTPLANPSNGLPRFKSKSTKVLLLTVSILPIAFMLLAIYIAIFNDPSSPLVYIFGTFFYVLLTGLIVFYVVDIYRNQSVACNQRMLWAVLLIIGSFTIFPFYWYFHIWNRPHNV